MNKGCGKYYDGWMTCKCGIVGLCSECQKKNNTPPNREEMPVDLELKQGSRCELPFSSQGLDTSKIKEEILKEFYPGDGKTVVEYLIEKALKKQSMLVKDEIFSEELKEKLKEKDEI